eukprot:4236092-Amphidinium_carterae.2
MKHYLLLEKYQTHTSHSQQKRERRSTSTTTRSSTTTKSCSTRLTNQQKANHTDSSHNATKTMRADSKHGGDYM